MQLKLTDKKLDAALASRSDHRREPRPGSSRKVEYIRVAERILHRVGLPTYLDTDGSQGSFWK